MLNLLLYRIPYAQFVFLHILYQMPIASSWNRMCVCVLHSIALYLIRYVSFIIMHAIASVAYKLLFRVCVDVCGCPAHWHSPTNETFYSKKRIWAIKSTIKSMPKPFSKIKTTIFLTLRGRKEEEKKERNVEYSSRLPTPD